MKKVLALGYIPKWRGGGQLTGLATGLFDLHNAVNQIEEGYRVVIAATDIFEQEKLVDHTTVIGWNRKILLKHSLCRFYRLLFFFIQAGKLNFKYSKIPFWGTFMKMIFLDYAIEKEMPDIVHLHGATYALYIRALWRKDLPVVLRLHGLNGFDSTISNYKQYAQIEKDIIQLPFSLVTFVTSSICEEWKKCYGRFRCPMIPLINGYNSDIFYPAKGEIEKEYSLITIAGISERKGQGRVMEALKILRDNYGIDLNYLVVGNGDNEYTQKIKDYAQNNNLNVVFIDYCPQNKLNELLWKSKFFIQPSASEGFGKTYIEAAAAGIPSILPETLPIAKEPDILSEVNALFTKDEKTESIVDVLKNINKYSFNKSDVSQSVAHLNWTSLARRYVELYNMINE